MTTLRVKQVKTRLIELFATHLDVSDLRSDDAEHENKVLSRCLAAFGIYTAAGCTEREAAAAVWDGSGDCGVDGGYFEPSESRVVLVQAKWITAGNGEPSAKDIGAFANGVKDIVEQNTDHFAPRLQGRLKEIGIAINSPGTTIEIVLISTGASTISSPGARNIDRLLCELNGNDSDDPLAFKTVMGLSEVYAGLASDKSREGVTVEANILEWSYIAQPVRAYFGIIDGLQLKAWWTNFRKGLVTTNIRHALGSTEVNSQIRSTAMREPEYFWYYNNGITLVANESSRAPAAAASRSSGIFKFEGASIVNGAQTVSTLGRVEDENSLGRVRVPIRVILLGSAPPNFGREVTRTNNLQNRVEARDFAAQDPEQMRIQIEMRMEAVEYQYLRSEDFVSSPSSCELIEVTTALACATADPSFAVQVKTGIGRFFNDLRKPPYIALFNPSLSGAKAFNATLVQRTIDVWIESKKESFARKSGFGWGLLIHGNRLFSCAVFDLLGQSCLTQPISDFRELLPKLPISRICEDVYDRMLASLETRFPGKFLAVLFKSPSKCKQVFEDVTAPGRRRNN
jgi:hypothetical protein